MNILFPLGTAYPAQAGGPDNTIFRLSKALVNNGHAATIVAFNERLSSKDIIKYNIKFNIMNKIEGVPVYYFSYFIHRYLCFNMFFWLIKHIKEYDFVVLTSYHFPVSWLSAFICNLCKVPFSIAPRGEFFSSALKYNLVLKKIMRALLLRHLYAKARFVMVTSMQELQHSRKYFRKNTNFEVIPNYIEITLKNEVEFSKKKDFIFMGRIHSIKNIENLITAYSMLPESVKCEHNLLIAGTGEDNYIKQLQLRILPDDCSRVLFLGHITGLKKNELLSNAKVFVLPSHSENFGNVVLEALTYSTPVIASKNTPWSELDSKCCGKWINNDAQSIMEALSLYVSMEPRIYEQECINAFKFVSETFDVKNNIDSFVNKIKKYCKRNS